MMDNKSQIPQKPILKVTSRKSRMAKASKFTPRSARIALGLGALAVLMIIALPVTWLIIVAQAPNRELIVRVNDTQFDMNYYIKQLRSIKNGSTLFGLPFDASTQPFQLVQTMMDNEIIRQSSTLEGLNVTDAEVNEEIRKRLLPSSDPTQEDPKRIERDLAEKLKQYTIQIQLSESEYRNNVRGDLLREKLTNKLGLLLPNIADQAHYKIIQVDTAQQGQPSNQDKLDFVKKEIANGVVDFGTMARNLSDDQTSADKDGDAGWVPPSVVPHLDQFLFGVQPKKISEIITGPDGQYVAFVSEKRFNESHIYVIKTTTRDEAFNVVSRFNKGEDFIKLAAELNTDPELKAKSGDLGFLSRGYRDGFLDEVIAGLPIGKISRPIENRNNTVWVLVVDRQENRTISEQSLNVLKNNAVDEWLKQKKDKNVNPDSIIEQFFDSDKYAYALEQVNNRVDLKRTPQPETSGP